MVALKQLAKLNPAAKLPHEEFYRSLGEPLRQHPAAGVACGPEFSEREPVGHSHAAMPFTFSHPALIIPLLRARRRWPWLSATGLIAGSVAPDFEKFFRLRLASGNSHTLASIFYFSCPVGLVLACLFHLLVRRPLLAHLPAALRGRLNQFAGFDWLAQLRRYPWGVWLSLAIGAALHLFWDGFTHNPNSTASLLPGLDRVVWIHYRPVSLSQLLAIGSSGLGGLAIAWAVWRMPVRRAGLSPGPAALGRYWGGAALVAGGLLSQWLLLTRPGLLAASIAAISASLLGILVISVYVSWRGELRR